MDIDFPLILVIAVLVTGIAWGMHKFGKATGKYVEFGGSFFPVLLLVLLLRSFLFEPFKIPSGSMIPTLNIGDFILVNKYSYGLRLPVLGTKVVEIGEPQRGDVMVFIPPHKDQYYIKRVIGVPGDKIDIRDGVLYVNDEMMEQTPHPLWASPDPSYTVQMEQLNGAEHAIRRQVNPGRYSVNYSTVVEPEYYLMIGDNRDDSYDSRAWGQVHESMIVGKAVAVWMHWDKFFSLPSFGEARLIE